MGNRIYIVEDDKDISFILDYFLREEGFNVSVFGTVSDFKNAIKTAVPDLFLLDVMLPDGDGITVCNQVKADPKTSYLPVIMMSAHVMDDSKIDCPAEEFIPKPFDLDRLLMRINYHLHISGPH
ncbi:response regulator transcription factor [Pedobacter caeni]|uniref:Response regulator receiver domain-containing protein n=1 Tax=Pedobacter caeni TaxID=288992 RepID=A0A1M5JTA8_9SPHI|nr:response regulator transcription factor [Pedobacter caeni]SHG43510.1 Response regulator receiver domain-containing protein [Pedobacter caeni]